MVYRFPGIELDTDHHIFTVNSREVYLTPIEWRIMVLFMSNPYLLITTEQMIDHAWPRHYEVPLPDAPRWHVENLRSKMGQVGWDCIQTVIGFGYRFMPYTSNE